jgi:3-hydroxy-9,10-secoandrosta-1,3,5(10)-triene-9,17-dione monooxygenase
MSSASLRTQLIDVPEPDLTPREIISRAAALREYLRDEQEATEQRTYYSPQTHELFKEAGLYRILQPRRFGGYEFDIETFYRVVMELARGCPSTGWCFCLGAAHVLQVAALFPEEAQRQIFAADDGHFVAASRDLPAGTVTQSGDGYVVAGTWNYCSGAPYSTHFIARALLADARGQTSADSPAVLVAIPRADWTMLDDWHGLLGLRGSGSHSIQVKEAQVPGAFVVTSDPFSFDTAAAAQRSGVHPNPMYNSRHLNFFHGEIGAIMTGMADAATDEYERIIRTSKTSSPLPPGLRMDAPDHQRTLGLGLAKASAARQIVLGAARQHLEHCRQAAEDDVPYEAEQDLLLESTHGQAGELAFSAIENLARMSGSSNAVRDGRRMQRYLRDALVYRSHQQGASIDMMAAQLAVARLHAKR